MNFMKYLIFCVKYSVSPVKTCISHHLNILFSYHLDDLDGLPK